MASSVIGYENINQKEEYTLFSIFLQNERWCFHDPGFRHFTYS